KAEDGIRDFHVTGVQTCALPIYQAAGLVAPDVAPGQSPHASAPSFQSLQGEAGFRNGRVQLHASEADNGPVAVPCPIFHYNQQGQKPVPMLQEIGRASCREMGPSSVGW